MPAKHDKRVLRWFRRIKIHEITITGSVPVTSAPRVSRIPFMMSTILFCTC